MTLFVYFRRATDGFEGLSTQDSQDLTDSDMITLDSGVRHLSRQSSMTSISDNITSRLDVGTTSEEEEFSETDLEDDDEESSAMGDIN